MNPIVGSFQPQRSQSSDKRLKEPARACWASASSSETSDDLKTGFDVVANGADRRRRGALPRRTQTLVARWPSGHPEVLRIDRRPAGPPRGRLRTDRRDRPGRAGILHSERHSPRALSCLVQLIDLGHVAACHATRTLSWSIGSRLPVDRAAQPRSSGSRRRVCLGVVRRQARSGSVGVSSRYNDWTRSRVPSLTYRRRRRPSCRSGALGIGLLRGPEDPTCPIGERACRLAASSAWSDPDTRIVPQA